jgi:hypothetical protein
LPCATLACSGTSGSWGAYNNGGAGSGYATGSITGGFTNNLLTSSSAAFASGSFLPVLRARSAGLEEIGTHPGFSSLCCYVNYGSAIAQGVQYYSYLGASPQSYSLTFNVDGVITAGAFGNISGSLLVSDGIPDAFGELPFGNALGFDQAIFGGNGAWNATRTISFTVNPGEGFYVVGSLFASVSPFGNGDADAANTFRVAFTDGDVSMLAATLNVATDPATVVPEPSTVVMLAAGMLMLAVVGRRRLA